jgi:CBS domain-containing protein/anti-sigma regulatory factor (Ser/Thr protein kinase)
MDKALPFEKEATSDAVVELLLNLRVQDVMTSDLVLAGPKDTMYGVQLSMKEHHCSGVPIVDHGSLVGMISMQNVLRAYEAGDIQAPAERYMSRDIMVLQNSMPVSFCVSYFDKYRFHRFPVLNSKSELVGMVTQYDVIRELLKAMTKQVEILEKATARQNAAGQLAKDGKAVGFASGNTAEPILLFDFEIEFFNFDNAGKASTTVKKFLKAEDVNPELSRRIGIASYELEINQVVHSIGGWMRYFLHNGDLIIEASDEGPGIADVEKALSPGFSTASDAVREMGFGAGMGLPNVIRVSDDFRIDSAPGKGTTVKAIFHLEETK